MSAKKKLRSVLEYTEKLLSLNEKIVFNIEKSSIATFHEAELFGREGIELAQDGEAWISLRRLRETKPPPAPDTISDWLKAEPRSSPNKPPELVGERCVRLGKSEIAELVAAERLSEEDVLEPIDKDKDGRSDAILRIEKFPEITNEWQSYLDGPWAEWSRIEKPRREGISLYNKLYQIHQRMMSLGDDNPIELILGCGVAVWKRDDVQILSPIVEQLVETSLDEVGTLSLSPRTLSPTISLKCFHALEIEGSDQVQREASALLSNIIEDPDVEFSPFSRVSYEKILQTCASKLSASGRYQTGDDIRDRAIPQATSDLTIVDTWVVVARQRSDDVRKDDIRRLMKQVDDTEREENLPAAALKFVEPPSNTQRYQAGIDLTNETLDLPDAPRQNPRWSSSGSVSSDDPTDRKKGNGGFFFPLPYNDDQVAIAEALKDAEGVIVQGPPGTGKTHTIANIISHFLATQRRVLVTAKTPEALTALQEKLPEGIRNLAISIIHNDREGAKQLEAAMRVITDEVKQVSPRRLEEELRDKQARLAQIRNRLSEIDSALLEIARRNLTEVDFEGEKIGPMKLAEFVAGERQLHEWFPDELGRDISKPLQLSPSHMQNIRALRSSLGEDLKYLTVQIPDPQKFPQLDDVLKAHAKLKDSQDYHSRLTNGEVPLMATAVSDAVVQAQALREYLISLANYRSTIDQSAWMKALAESLVRCLQNTDHFIEAKSLLNEWLDLASAGKPLLELELANVAVNLDDPKLEQAIQDLCVGKKPFGLLAFGKSELREQIGEIRIQDREPDSKEDWVNVRACRTWYRKVGSFLTRWDKVGAKISLPNHARELARGAKVIVSASELIRTTLVLVEQMPEQLSIAKKLFPYGVNIGASFDGITADLLVAALSANLLKYDLAEASRVREFLRALNTKASLPLDDLVAELEALLGSQGTTDHQLAQAWSVSFEEVRRLSDLKANLHALDQLCDFVAQTGAPKWASMLRNLGNSQLQPNALTPDHWDRSWRWAQAKSFIADVTATDRLKRLSSEQEDLNSEQQRLIVDIVRLRTFLGLKAKLSDKIEAALSKFAAAIARLGSGTGKSASRYRRIIRESTSEAARAIPCWILPEWRVSEQIPAELGLFDLVIVDEASQSDITALSAIMRGKKVLIVGDDKQVSPTTIGIEERQIIQLRTTYLSGIPNADQMDPGSSLYELASTVFPGRVILLREHFRCVEPIIRFSSQFYPQPLIPLRLPTASQRLSPPLIDVYLPEGSKTRDTNRAEAEYIVREIRQIVEDENMSHRSIGVISLIGDKQAKMIYDMLVAEVGTDVMDRHRIMCGNAAAFQGQERDVVFLSMVECQKSATAKTTRMFAQRFNVAMSRARDRVYLVRSVSSSDLKSTDLKLKLIEHFRNPMESGNVSVSKDILSLCDSGFERAVAGDLLRKGYRIRPQVPVGGFKIDIVVEGAGDRRLAIELDGDKYHGPDRWAADVQRQRALERLGWRFWRCWGSQWISDSDGCMSDLVDVLTSMGIDPIGPSSTTEVWTEHRRISTRDEQSKPEPEVNAVTPVDSGIAQSVDESDAPVQANSGSALLVPGDRIAIRLSEGNKLIRMTLSSDANHPEGGVVHISQPLGQILTTASIDDELDFDLAGATHKGTVERIFKAEDR